MAEIASLVVNVAGNITGAVNSFKSLEQTSRSTAKKIESNFSSLKNIGVGLFSSAILKNIVDTVILPYQFDAAEMRQRGVQKIQITKDVVDSKADPVLLFKKTNAKKQQNK